VFNRLSSKCAAPSERCADSRFKLLMAEWIPLQQHLATRSIRGAWRVVAGSDHMIANSQPHAVAVAVLEMLAQIRQQSGRQTPKPFAPYALAMAQ
jgi:hypothetical protein